MTGEPELAARVEAELRAQGLRRAVGDPTAIRRIAALLGAEDPGREKSASRPSEPSWPGRS